MVLSVPLSQRQFQEQQLREETAGQIGQQRRQLGYGAEKAAGQFAEQYGMQALPSQTIEQQPSVVSGIPQFTRTGQQQPLYQLSDDVYKGLIGSQQKERLTGIRSLAQFREQQTRLGQATPNYSQYEPRAITF